MQQHLKPLPIGESDIVTLLNNDFLYVDKTKFIYEMIKVPGKFFLSKPRRFGKSLLLSTLYEAFNGNKELFKDQWIYKSDWDWQKYPIIRLDFNVDTDVDLKDYIKEKLRVIAIANDIFDENDFNRLSYGLYFNDIIFKLYDKYDKTQVVILIDEYDKPILDVITDIKMAEAKRDILKGFYGIIKGVDEYIRFAFLTGVTKFSKVGVFSGLNNLRDISMSYEYASICGITQEELVFFFKEHIKLLAKSQDMIYEDCLLKIKDWYNGFCFCKNGISVYNPFSTLLVLQEKDFSNYWFASGSPTFLIKLMKQQSNFQMFKLDNCQLKISQFETFEINNLNLNAILFQAGYLTIKDYDKSSERFVLSYPNREINKSFKENVFELFGKTQGANSSLLLDIVDALNAGDVDSVIDALKQIFINIDYDIKIS